MLLDRDNVREFLEEAVLKYKSLKIEALVPVVLGFNELLAELRSTMSSKAFFGTLYFDAALWDSKTITKNRMLHTSMRGVLQVPLHSKPYQDANATDAINMTRQFDYLLFDDLKTVPTSTIDASTNYTYDTAGTSVSASVIDANAHFPALYFVGYKINVSG